MATVLVDPLEQEMLALGEAARAAAQALALEPGCARANPRFLPPTSTT